MHFCFTSTFDKSTQTQALYTERSSRVPSSTIKKMCFKHKHICAHPMLCMHTCTQLSTHIHTHSTYTCTQLSTHIHINVYSYVHSKVHTYMLTYMYTHTHIHVYSYVYNYTVKVHTHTYTQTFFSSLYINIRAPEPTGKFSI